MLCALVAAKRGVTAGQPAAMQGCSRSFSNVVCVLLLLLQESSGNAAVSLPELHGLPLLLVSGLAQKTKKLLLGFGEETRRKCLAYCRRQVTCHS